MRGGGFIARRPAWQAGSRRVFDLLQRHQVWVMLGFRFVYGFRTLTPVIIGASRIPPLRFFMLNGAGAAVWAVTLGTLGYFVGHGAEIMLGEVKRYELQVLGEIAAVGVILWAAYAYRQVVSRGR